MTKSIQFSGLTDNLINTITITFTLVQLEYYIVHVLIENASFTSNDAWLELIKATWRSKNQTATHCTLRNQIHESTMSENKRQVQ